MSATTRAAVAIVVRDGGADHEVLLIRRSQREDDPWSGHMAFPGGRHDQGDRDLLDTAVRETLEEIGLDLREHGELLGRLDDLPAIARGRSSGLAIAPFVFAIEAPPPPFQLNHEVDEVVWAELAPLWTGAAATSMPYEHEGRNIELPGYRVGAHVVWGLTHRMLGNLFAALEQP